MAGVILACAFVPGALALAANAPGDPRSIMRRAEEIRAPESSEMKIKLDTTSRGTESSYTMKLLATTGRRSYSEFLAPSEERGRRMLALGRNYFSTLPDSKRVVPVSRRELIGNSAFAIADLFQIDTEKEYEPKLAGEETIGKEKALRLELTAVTDDAPYAKIHYFVRPADSFPLGARFYGISGKLLKTLSVVSMRELGGMVRPDKLRMDDNVTKGKFSIWSTLEMTRKKIPDRVFTREYLQSQQ
ncbi:MAG: hypothetical protein RIQ81_2529 [Pseudomonadota bacterium]|jgi:hypothetical protein